MCRPDKQVRYDHIDELFADVIDWKLIETHLSDMLRVVLSIKAGKFTASTILRKLRAETVAGFHPVEVIGALSPYLTKHINRFGSYSLDLNRKPPALNLGFFLIPS